MRPEGRNIGIFRCYGRDLTVKRWFEHGLRRRVNSFKTCSNLSSTEIATIRTKVGRDLQLRRFFFSFHSNLLDPARKGITAARLPISNRFSLLSGDVRCFVHRIRSIKAKMCRKRQTPRGLGRMKGIYRRWSLSQYLRGINVSDHRRYLPLMRPQRGSLYLFERGLAIYLA